MPKFTEDTVEQATLDWLRELGYTVAHGPDIEPESAHPARQSFDEAILLGRLRAALGRINTHIPPAPRAGVIEEAIRKATRPPGNNPLVNNHALHRLLTEGVDVSYKLKGQTKHDKVWLVDFDRPQQNDWLAINQFTVTGVNPKSQARTNRRPDVVLFVNGLPLVVIELKNPADETATLKKAYHQLQTYKTDVAQLFVANAALVVADGRQARMGALTSGFEWFKRWRSLDGETLARCAARAGGARQGRAGPRRPARPGALLYRL